MIVCFVFLGTTLQFIPAARAVTYSYTLTGPFWDDGTVSNLAVGVAASYVDGSVYRTTLNESGGDPQTVIITASSPVSQILWSTIGTNYSVTRYLDIDPRIISQSFNIMIPSSLFASYNYAIEVSDFSGMTNAYIRTERMVSGTNQVVEQRSLANTGDVYFLLAQWGTYTLNVICDQGSYSISYMAENPSATYKLLLTQGSFGSLPDVSSHNIYAKRASASEIDYWGSSNSTISAWQVLISHYDIYSISKDQVIDFNQTGTGPFSGAFTVPYNSSDYTANILVTEAGVPYAFVIPCPASAAPDQSQLVSVMNSFGFGDLGINPLGLIAFLICVTIGACFSYANFELGIGAVFVTSIVLGFLGFPAPAGANAVVGGFIVFLAYVHKAKMTERDM